MMKAGLAMLLGLLCLSGCKGEPKPAAAAGTAQGEVLPGAASDAMLPLDTVKSQAPLAPKSEGGEAGDAKTVKKGDKPAAAKSGSPADAEPAASASAAEPPTPD